MYIKVSSITSNIFTPEFVVSDFDFVALKKFVVFHKFFYHYFLFSSVAKGN